MRLLVLFVLPAAVIGTDLIGTIIPPYPAGHTQYGGCIYKPHDPVGKQEICPYAIGFLGTGPGGFTGIYAAKLDRREERKVFWKVTDVIPYPKVEPGWAFVYGTCRIRGKDDDSVLAVVRNTGGYATWARKVDLPSGRFTSIALDAVECDGIDEGD